MTRGRYMKASELHKTVNQLISGGHSLDTPVWHNVLYTIPPSEMMVRTRPPQLEEASPKRLLPKDTFKPHQIIYEEDRLRRRFYKDHPWELARPRVIVERHGTEARHWDWSKGLRQPGLALCGESVIQRQMWLMHNYTPPPPPRKKAADGSQAADKSQGMESQSESLVESEPQPKKIGLNVNAAYDMARREFYTLRLREEVAVRIQREESRMVGGRFGQKYLQFAEKQEDKAYALWHKWARANLAEIKAEKLARTSSDVVVEEEEALLPVAEDANEKKPEGDDKKSKIIGGRPLLI